MGHGRLRQASLAALAVVVLAAGALQPALAQSAGDIIAERRALMQSNNANYKVLKAFLKGKGSVADIVRSGKRIAANAARIPTLFPKGTSEQDGVGATRAKAAIWARWAEFKAAAASLGAEAVSLTRVATGGDKAAIKAAVKRVNRNGCTACHKRFRAKKKKR